MNVYEITLLYTNVEVHHVKGESEEQALHNFSKGEGEFYKTYDGNYISEPEVSSNEGPWLLADYEEEYGEWDK
jgi:hypothetical protein